MNKQGVEAKWINELPLCNCDGMWHFGSPAIYLSDHIRALIASALQQQREADDAAFEKAIGGKEDSYKWHTPDASMHNHMRTARNDLRAEARAAWNKYRKESR